MEACSPPEWDLQFPLSRTGRTVIRRFQGVSGAIGGQ